MGKFVDLTGQRFNNLVVLKRASNTEKSKVRYVCRCDCGKETVVLSESLKSGNTKSCGCLARTHGKTGTRLLGIHNGMIQRCYNPKRKGFKSYGGRGITVCEEWRNDFQAFYDWAMSNGYAEDLTIDRIDSNGNYEPSNCRWATLTEQANNKRNNHFLTINGESKTISQWARESGIPMKLLWQRVKRGWIGERLLQELTKRY